MTTLTSRGANRVCTRCVMDTSDPEIVFDEVGNCNHCRNYFARVEREVRRGEAGRRHLAEIADRIRKENRGREYDCVIGVSGGVDSTMVAYVARHELQLRPLAVHLDNGWNSELAVDNIRRTLNVLGIDLLTHVIDWDEFRDLQLSFLRASVPNCEIPTDHAITALLFHQAARHGLRYILSGGNVVTEGIYPLSWGYYNFDLRHLRAIHRRFGSAPLKTLPTISIPQYLWHLLARRTRVVNVLNHIDYNREDAINVLQQKLGWRPYGGKHYESIYTRFFQGYILPRKFGYDKRRAHLSALVCAGQLSRAEALAALDRDPYDGHDLRSDKLFVTKKLGLSLEEFDEIMRLPPRSFRDYPSNYWAFGGLPRIRAALKRLATRG